MPKQYVINVTKNIDNKAVIITKLVNIIDFCN